MHRVLSITVYRLATFLGRALALSALASSAAYGTCSGVSPNIVCTSNPGVMTLNTTTATDLNPQTASVYPSNNVVSGLVGTITSVQVRLNGLTHNWLHDLDMVLVSPTGQQFVFWSDVGTAGNIASNAITNQTLTIGDTATLDLPQGATVNNTSYRPRNYESLTASPDIFPAPAGFSATVTNSAAPLGSATFASRFNGANPNGTWQLFIALDSAGPDTGSLQSWDLIFATATANAATTTAVTSSVNPVQIPLAGNSTATISATVTSSGNPVTLGTVSFFEGATALATNVPVNGSGMASFTFNTTGVTAPVLGEGIHIINASYSGATGFGASSGAITQSVDRATQVTGNSYCNTGRITVPQAIAPASVYPSKIFVTSLSGSIQSVVMDIKGFTNPATDDVNMLLVSPTGQKFVPFAYISDFAGSTSGANIKLDDLSGNTLPNSGPVASGTYRPSHGLNGSGISPVTFVSPAPAGPYSSAAPGGSATFTSTFSGVSPNGTWNLYTVNWANTSGAGTREITNGWCLTLGTSSDPATTTTPTVTPSPSAVGQSATISALVANASTSAPVNAQGTVTFKEGNTVLAGPISVGSNGVASFTKSDFTQGAHFIDAFYSGAPGFFGVSNGQVLHYVDAATTNPSAGRFCNATPLTFPNAITSGTPYPTRINASGLAGVLSKVTVELNGFSHQFPDDVDLMVTGPNGNSLIAFSDVGGGNAVSGVNVILDSTAASTLPDSTALSSGIFRPGDFDVGTDTFAAPAPTVNVFSASSTTLGTVFNNSNPNGVWSLWTKSDGAGVQGGGSLANGWCVNITTNPPVLGISKTHSGNFTQGQTGAQYTVTVGSNGPGSTAGTITLVDNPPSGLTITAMAGSGWTCTVGTRTCTTAAVIPANGALPPVTVTVSVANNATSPQINSATVSGGGASSSATATDSTIILPGPDLTISKTTSSTFVQGSTASYTLIVNNTGPGASSGNYTISDTMPTGLTIALPVTGSTWDCTASTTTFVSCVRSTPIPANVGSAPAVAVNVNIASNAPASITNTATVSGGGELNTANNAGSVTSSVTQLAPDLTITKVAQGSGFQQGGTVTYLLTVTNSGNGPTAGTITMQDTIPTGLTVTAVSGANWTCTNAATVSCTRTLPMAAATTSVITLAANIAANAPASITNTAAVQVAGESNTGNNSGTSVISVAAVAPDLTITKVAQGSGFQQGGTVTYLLTVTNSGNGPTAGTITMQDTIPTGLTVTSVSVANWTCTNAATVSCTRTLPMAAATTSVITLAANIAANAPASITNTAAVQVTGESNTGNNSGSSVISVAAVAPDLTITKVAQGSGFQQGGTVTYLLTVTNSGNGPTAGTITMQDTIPTGLTVTSVSGAPDWTCNNAATVVCTRTTPIPAAGSSVITLAANIAANAPASITNTAAVQVAGESNTGNNSGSSVISVTAAAPDLTIQKTSPSTFVQGGTASYSLTVFNVGNAPTTGTITVTDTMPTGITITAPASGSGWTCSNTATSLSCTRTTPIAANNGVAPSIAFPVAIASNAPASITNTASVAGGGETNTSNNSASMTSPVASQTAVTVNVPVGIGFTLNSVNYTGSQTVNLAPGTYTLSTASPQSLGVGSRAVFTAWSDAGPISHSITVGAVAVNITGSFTTQYQLTTAAGSGGTVTPATGSFFDVGTVVNLTAAPNSGFAFSNWSGPVANAGSAATTVTMDAAKSVTANFTAIPNHTLTVNLTGTTWGSVVSTPSGINCPGTCAADFVSGTVVTLTRQVNTVADGEFVGWTGPATCATAANSSSATCAVTMTAPQSAAARFTVSCRLDVDGDNAVTATTDILLITRRILGMSGAPVIGGGVNPAGIRTTEAAINAYMAPRITENRFDVNLDGVTDWRDAAILLRAFTGFTGNDVTNGLITPASQRQFWDQPTPSGASEGIKQYLNSHCAVLIP